MDKQGKKNGHLAGTVDFLLHWIDVYICCLLSGLIKTDALSDYSLKMCVGISF